MPERSAGILLYRIGADGPEVLLVHPGGPFWAKKDDGAWSIPKGLVDPGEDPLVAAKREFFEETGHAPEGEFLPLGDFRYSSGKIVSAWAVEGDFDIERIPQRDVRDGMAAEIGTAGEISGGGSGGMVRDGRREAEDP